MKTNLAKRTAPNKTKMTDEELLSVANMQSEQGLEDFQLTSKKEEPKIPSRTQINKIYTAMAREAEEKIRQK